MQQLTTERLNRLLYSSKDRVYFLLKIVTYINSTLAACLLVYGYGFNLSTEETSRIFKLIDLVYLVFVIIYAIRLLYSFQRRAFIQRTSTEAVIMFLLVINGIITNVFAFSILYQTSLWLGIKNYNAFHEIVSTIFLLTLIGLEVSKASIRLPLNRLKPSTLFIGSFILLIVTGAGLLMLPAMTNTPSGMPLLDALFTATSAACVTGLIVVDTATYFTNKGQLIILTLIQIGGLGMLTFTTFFATILKQGVGIKHQSAIQDFLSSESLFSSRGLLQQIILLTLFIEGMGALAVFVTWGPEVPFENLGDKIFYSIFHSISAFCNAGFSLYTNGLYEAPVRQSYILHIVIAGVIIFGGLGFSPIMDVFSIRALRERLAMPWKDWRLNTKLAIYTAIVLNIFGMVLYFFLEKDNTLAGMNILESLITSFFQSVTTRTAGFNTVDFTKLENPTMIMMMFLMFIGASPGSTGGGIKTITFLLIAVSVLSTIKGKKVISIDKRTIPMETLFKAYSVITFAAAYIFLGVFILSITEPEQESIDLLFEQVSAFATVGLSTGVTPQLSTVGRIVIIATMFIGRVGTITLALALSRPVISNAYRYPDAHLMVG
ncbi:potassium transporter TrkG [Rhodocytophaga aerolata]|uniref:Potassium transporter TrkG n=1 Tax=Rhodocytophaga aerolata TaxID=455078 RepID=A0ABT8QY36_9BACT|nr:potassium transporter TrkG [Rhodocytophaga aerolata]MDO1444749.1 potassium transporter TrkG [Rhodocytophaga aerolata]